MPGTERCGVLAVKHLKAEEEVPMFLSRNLNKYNAFKNHLEVEAVGETDQQSESESQPQRNYIVFADIYHRAVNQSLQNRI